MICPKCQFDNPELNRFCAMCGNRLRDSGAQADQPGAADVKPIRSSDIDDQSHTGKTNGGSTRRPFIVSTTAMGDTTGQVLNTRGGMPPTTVGGTHSSYIPVTPLKTRNEVEEISHGEGAREAEPAPVDPHDEPLFARPVLSKRNESVRELKTSEEQEREQWVQRAVSERDRQRPVSDAPVSGSILGLTAPMSEPEIHDVESNETAESPTETEQFAAQPESRKFLHFDDAAEARSQDVSGPSFLGLGASESPDYLLEDETSRSHSRGYLLLFALVIVAVLGVLEWRASSRGESTNPMDVLHLKLPKRKGQGDVVVEPRAANGSSSSTAEGSASTGNNNGKPDLIAEPNQPAVQPAPAGGQASAPQAAEPSAQSSANSGTTGNTGTATAATASPASSSPQPPEQQADEEKTPPPAATTKPAASAPKPVSTASAGKKAAASKPSAATTSAQPAADSPDPSLNAGSFELQKGIAAGATNMGRTWLWRAMSKGNGEAPVLLADMYAQGKGVARDCEQAVLLLKAAAKKANPRARSKLGSMYAAGQCVPQDRVEAYKWMHAALQVNPGSEWIERNRETIWNQMTASERRRAAVYR